MTELSSKKEGDKREPEMTAEGKIWWEHDVKAACQFAQGLRHQLNNALTPILGIAGLRMRKPVDAQDRKDSDVIIKACGKIKSYVDRIAELQACCSAENYHFNKFSTTDLISLSIGVLDPDITVAVLGEATILADSGHFSKAIEELLKNSADAGAKNVAVEIRVDKGKIKLTITDDGEGIALEPEEMFGLSSSSMTDERGSSQVYSFGLFMAKTIITKHGGAIEIKRRDIDEPGQKGTRVNITLPCSGSKF